METLEQITQLLYSAGKAHGQYEEIELHGIYDQDWHMWYAKWALENGLNDLLHTHFNTDTLSMLLYTLNEDHKRTDRSLDWAEYTAKRLIEG